MELNFVRATLMTPDWYLVFSYGLNPVSTQKAKQGENIGLRQDYDRQAVSPLHRGDWENNEGSGGVMKSGGKI